MKITKRELVNLHNAMAVVKDKLKSVSITSTKVYYPIAKNLNKIQEEIMLLKELDPTKLEVEFNKERIPLVEEIAKKDEEGNPIMITHENGTSSYDIPDDEIKGLEEKLNNIWDTKYKDDFQIASKQFSELLAEEIEIDLLKVNIEDLNARLPELETVVIDSLLTIID